MFKKVLAGLATIGLALGMVVATATSASAHHSTISAEITCNSQYQYDVKWSVSNSEKWLETITDSSDPILVPPTTTTLGDHETKFFYESFSSPVNKTLTLSASWANPDGTVTHEDSGKIKKNDFPNCAPNHVPVPICHATPPDTAAQGWVSEHPDDDSIVKSGHNLQHALDIIPEFDYWEMVDDVWTLQHFYGKNLGTNFSGFSGSSILTSGCAMKVTPGIPTFNPAGCLAPGVQGTGSYTIPSTPGVKFSVRINGGNWNVAAANTYLNIAIGTYIEVKAEPVPGWVILQGTTSWSYTVPNPGDCILKVAPVAPDVVKITQCDMWGSVTFKTTPGVVYELIVGDGVQGAYTVKATPAPGYKFAGSQVVLFSDNLGVHTLCVTPTAAGFEPSQCDAPGEESGGTYTIPVKEGVQYQVKIGDDPYADAGDGTFPVTVFPTTVTVRALAKDGYTLVGYTGPWPYTFLSAGDCLDKATPVAPDIVKITACDTYGSVTFKVTEGVEYALTAGNGLSGAFTVTATPAEGYYFDGGLEKIEFSDNLGVYTDCVTPITPGFTDSDCSPEPPLTEGPQIALVGFAIPGFFTIPTTEGVQYSASINGAPFVDYSAGDYEVADEDTVVVRATALPGYTLEGTAEWEHTFAELGVCDLPTFAEVLASASAKSQTCTAQGALLVELAEHVLYHLGDEPLTAASTPKGPGTYVVTASTDSEDYTIIGPTSWTLIITAASGCDPVLASTGATASLLGGSIGAGLLFLGGVALFMRRRFGATAD
jgi:hypothetical protein